jgi:hypothetical protein
MNHKHDDQKKNDQTSSILDDNAQGEHSTDTKSSIDREEERDLL